MKQIKVSTVKMTCDAQVINIDAHMVANAIGTQLNNALLCGFVDSCPGQTPDSEPGHIFDERAAISAIGRKGIADVLLKTQEFLDNLANAFLEDGNNEKK